MSLSDGLAALRLQSPARIPRTEYSADCHWSLVQAVTGLAVDDDSSCDQKQIARKRFLEAWNYDLVWNVLIHAPELGDWRTSMGHAIYQSDGGDFQDDRHCPFESIDQVLSFDPLKQLPQPYCAGLIERFEQDYQQQKMFYPDGIAMTGVYITLVSGLLELFGWDNLLMALGCDPEKMGVLAECYALWMQFYFDALANSDVPVVMVHDDIVWSSGPFCHPEWYRRYVFPNYRKLFQPLLDTGKTVLYTSDGNYTMFARDIAATGVHGFVMEPMTDLAVMAEYFGQTHVLIGNADTRILLGGDHSAIRAEVERCLNIGRKCPGFFMAVGNHIPPNTPVQSALFYNQTYLELSQR